MTRVIVAAVAIAVSACQPEPEDVVIAYAFPVTGKSAVAVARDELASWPQADGPRVRFVYDSIVPGDRPDVEIDRAHRLVEIPGLVAVVGHGGSRGSLLSAPVYNDSGIPQISPIATSRLLKDAGPWTFMLAPDDSVEGAFIGSFVAERLQAKRITIFYVNDEYGLGLRDGVIAALADGAATVVDQVPVTVESDFRPLVEASLARATPDAIVVAARYVETESIARIAHERGSRVPIVAGDGALRVPQLAVHAGPAADSVYVVAFWVPTASDSMATAFIERFRRVVGRDPVSADAMSHDGLMLAANAVQYEGARPADVRRYLLRLGAEVPPYRGVTGDITFQPDREPRLHMVRLHRGIPVLVEGS